MLELCESIVYNQMVMQDTELLNATFAALADPTRRAILARLASGQASVTQLAEPFDMSQPAISKHLKVLERAGLVVPGQDAQRRPRKLNPRPLSEASCWIETYRQHWEAAFARLDDVLEELKAEKKVEHTADKKDRKRKK
jgi:DNA-binding transcriptional ArsR family regulator